MGSTGLHFPLPTITNLLTVTNETQRYVVTTPRPLVTASCNRRLLTVSFLANHIALFFSTSPPPASAALDSTQASEFEDGAQELELERYTDDNEGFILFKPSSWLQVEKAGATALFEDPNSRANNVGVVVNPVRISSLSDFGSPQDVADRLIQAEKRKESTKGVEIVRVGERVSTKGFPVYEIEYKIDSTRGGIKRIFSAAFVAFKKLYLLNISHSDSQSDPLDPRTTVVLEKVLNSFDLLP